jgi:hypothetical protein
MNKFYLIVPIVLLGVFCVYYRQFSAQQDVIAQQKAQAEQAAADQVIQQKKDAMEKAQADQQAREQAQHAEEAQQEADHLAKFEASKQKLADETANFQQEADSYSKQAADLQVQLDSLQAEHEKLARGVFELQKQVELAKIDRRSADLEVQRTYDIVAQKVAASGLTYVPPPPAATVH